MQVKISSKHITVDVQQRERIERRLAAAAEKYFANPIDAHVSFSREARQIRADCSVHVGHGIKVQSHAEAQDAGVSFDTACDRLEKQLRRYKRRLRNHHGRRAERSEEETGTAQSFVLAAEPEHEEAPEEFQPVVVAETTTRIHNLTVGEAVMRMDLADLPVLMFKNSGSGELNVVYRRSDGHIGWIDPANSGRGKV